MLFGGGAVSFLGKFDEIYPRVYCTGRQPYRCIFIILLNPLKLKKVI